MTHSEHINEIASALAKAQGEMKNPGADTVNAFQKYTYAQADDFLNTVRGPLTKNGIAFVMDVERMSDAGKTLFILLLHSSGQWIKCYMPLENNIEGNKGSSQDQAWGSHLTYRKKNLISLVFGIHGDKDSDGQEEPLSKNTHQDYAQQKNSPPVKTNYEKVTSEQVQAIMFEIGEHTEIGQNMLKNFAVQKVADLPKEYYLKIVERIRSNVKAKKEQQKEQ